MINLCYGYFIATIGIMDFSETRRDVRHSGSWIAVDFQMLTYCTPGVELGYYFLLSLKHKMRQGRLEDSLQVYLKALHKATGDLGYTILSSFE